MKTADQLTPSEIEAYREAARQRQAQQAEALERRRECAWDLARQAAILLRDSFGATRVVVFGSLANEQFFTRWSDVDIAAWGLRPEDTFRAIGAVFDLDAEIPVNLVDVNNASTSLVNTIDKEGKEI
jgi:predicted nucleotidyltransferase